MAVIRCRRRQDIDGCVAFLLEWVPPDFMGRASWICIVDGKRMPVLAGWLKEVT